MKFNFDWLNKFRHSDIFCLYLCLYQPHWSTITVLTIGKRFVSCVLGGCHSTPYTQTHSGAVAEAGPSVISVHTAPSAGVWLYSVPMKLVRLKSSISAAFAPVSQTEL